jgi:hypothetical protein
MCAIMYICTDENHFNCIVDTGTVAQQLIMR